MKHIKLKKIIKSLESGSREKGGSSPAGIPSLGAQHLNNDGKLKLGDMKFVSLEHYESMSKGKIEKNDILIVKDGATTGKVSFVDSDYPYEKSAINEHVFRITLKEGYLPKYVFWYLFSQRGQSEVLKDFRGATVGGISTKFVEKVQIPDFSIETQKKIVEVLDKAQGLIDARKEQIKLMDELIQSVFYEMFGDPVTNPKGWEVSKLKNHINNIESGWSPKCLNNDAPKNKWGVLKLSAVTGGQYKEEYNKELPEDVSPRVGLEIKEGDLLFTRKNTPELVGDSCFVFKTREKLMMPDIIFRIQTKQTLNRLFLWAVFNTCGMKSMIKSLASGSAKSMSNISKAKLYDLQVTVPSIELQIGFENQVRKIVDYKEILLQSLAELENYNKVLFKELFEIGLLGG